MSCTPIIATIIATIIGTITTPNIRSGTIMNRIVMTGVMMGMTATIISQFAAQTAANSFY